ncbi:hypothetical protein D3C77_384360 [compost metagenome]
MLRRIHCNRVAGVDARSFDMLHNPRNEHGLAIANRIDFNLFPKHVAVDQNRMLRVDVDSLFHIFQELLIRIYNFHRPSA